MEPLTDRQWMELDASLAPSDKEPIRFLGWIYGDKEDRDVLTKLGVVGPMIWRKSDNRDSITKDADRKSGIFEKCEISLEVAKRLKQYYPTFALGTFTGIDEDMRQTIKQPLYRW